MQGGAYTRACMKRRKRVYRLSLACLDSSGCRGTLHVSCLDEAHAYTLHLFPTHTHTHTYTFSTSSAALLVARGTEVVVPHSTQPVPYAPAAPVRFTHDPRLREPSPAYFAEEQAAVALAAIECPVLAVTATHGWPLPGDTVRRLRRLRMLWVDGIRTCTCCPHPSPTPIPSCTVRRRCRECRWCGA
jgi:hypothetical protein